MERWTRRPGEAYDACYVALSDQLSEVESAAASLGLPIDLACALLIERAAVVGIAVETGLDVSEVLAALDRASITTPTISEGTPVVAAYLRTLGRASPRRQTRLTGDGLTVSVPSRLVRSAHLLCGVVSNSQSVDQARRWERSALLIGQTMTEWALLELLRAFARPDLRVRSRG